MSTRIFQFLFFSSLFLTLCSCKDDDEVSVNEPDQKDEFYATPFNNMPALNDVVMYEANQRLYAPNGSFKVITERLDEIQSLGVNVLWLMPVTKQGKEKAIGSPYCVQDYKKVEPEYGTLNDFRLLVEEAHKREMAVIIDWVANHTSWDHAWLKNTPDWYTQDANGQVGPPAGTNWNDVVDLDFNNRDMRKAMIEAMKYWVRETNIDGFRCDAADWVPADFWKDAIYELQNMQEGRTLLMLSEGTDPKNLQAGFDMDYGWNFTDVMEGVFNGTKSVANLYQSHFNEFDRIPAGKQKLRHNTNHDRASEQSAVQQFKNKEGALASFVISTTMGGVPLIYSSQEVAYDKTINFFNYVNIDWNQNSDFASSFKNIMNAYQSSDVFKTGELEVFPEKNAVCFTRKLNDQQALVVVNVRNEAITFSIPEELLGTKWTSMLDYGAVELSDNMSLKPYQYHLLLKE